MSKHTYELKEVLSINNMMGTTRIPSAGITPKPYLLPPYTRDKEEWVQAQLKSLLSAGGIDAGTPHILDVEIAELLRRALAALEVEAQYREQAIENFNEATIEAKKELKEMQELVAKYLKEAKAERERAETRYRKQEGKMLAKTDQPDDASNNHTDSR